MLYFLWFLLADAEGTPAAPPTPPGGQGGGADPTFLFLMLGIFVLFYFLFIRPMRRQEQERNAMINSLAKNDRVLTSGGIYGTVISVADKEDEVVVKVDDNVRLRMAKASIVRNLTKEEAAREAREAAKNKNKTAGGAPAAGS
jgi:preprotein translocase subunit YajC